jgi:hypothetical protein
MPVGGAAAAELAPGRVQLEWIPSPEAPDGDKAHAYVIRRSPSPSVNGDDPANIVAVVPAGMSVWADTIASPSSTIFYYTVSALDRGNNESSPSPSAAAALREAMVLRNALRPEESPTLAVDTLASGELCAAYRLPARMEVELEVVRRLGDGTPEVLSSPVREVQGPGAYLVPLQRKTGGETGLVVRLKAGARVVEREASGTGN